MVRIFGITAASCVLGVAITFTAGYVVLMFGPDLDAAYFGF